MKAPAAVFALATAAVLCLASPALADNVDDVYGYVYSNSSGGGLRGVKIEVNASSRRADTLSDSDGSWVLANLDVPDGTYTLTFSLTGYETVKRTVYLPAGDTSAAELQEKIGKVYLVFGKVGDLEVTSGTLPDAVKGKFYTTVLQAKGGIRQYEWSAVGDLPDGLELSRAGNLNGTPTKEGTFEFTVEVSDQSTPTKTARETVSLTVGDGSGGGKVTAVEGTVTDGSSTLADASARLVTESTTYSDATSVDGFFRFGGLSLAPGKYTLWISRSGYDDLQRSVDLGSGSNDLGTLVLTRKALAVTTTSLPDASVGRPYSAKVSATGGVPPYRYRIGAGSAPPGLSLSSNGTFASGPPTKAGSYGFTVEVLDATDAKATRSLSVLVTTAPPASNLWIVTTEVAPATVGKDYSADLTATGGTSPYSFRVLSGTPPPGLDLSSGGTIAGRPTAAGVYRVTVEVRDSAVPARKASQDLKIVVGTVVPEKSHPWIDSPAYLEATLNVSYAVALKASGGTAPYTWKVVSGHLPPGSLDLDSGGDLAGTPTAKGSFRFRAEATDANGITASKEIVLSVGNPGWESAGGGIPITADLLTETSPGHWSARGKVLLGGFLIAAGGVDIDEQPDGTHRVTTLGSLSTVPIRVRLPSGQVLERSLLLVEDGVSFVAEDEIVAGFNQLASDLSPYLGGLEIALTRLRFVEGGVRLGGKVVLPRPIDAFEVRFDGDADYLELSLSSGVEFHGSLDVTEDVPIPGTNLTLEKGGRLLFDTAAATFELVDASVSLWNPVERRNAFTATVVDALVESGRLERISVRLGGLGKPIFLSPPVFLDEVRAALSGLTGPNPRVSAGATAYLGAKVTLDGEDYYLLQGDVDLTIDTRLDFAATGRLSVVRPEYELANVELLAGPENGVSVTANLSLGEVFSAHGAIFLRPTDGLRAHLSATVTVPDEIDGKPIPFVAGARLSGDLWLKADEPGDKSLLLVGSVWGVQVALGFDLTKQFPEPGSVWLADVTDIEDYKFLRTGKDLVASGPYDQDVEVAAGHDAFYVFVSAETATPSLSLRSPSGTRYVTTNGAAGIRFSTRDRTAAVVVRADEGEEILAGTWTATVENAATIGEFEITVWKVYGRPTAVLETAAIDGDSLTVAWTGRDVDGNGSVEVLLADPDGDPVRPLLDAPEPISGGLSSHTLSRANDLGDVRPGLYRVLLRAEDGEHPPQVTLSDSLLRLGPAGDLSAPPGFAAEAGGGEIRVRFDAVAGAVLYRVLEDDGLSAGRVRVIEVSMAGETTIPAAGGRVHRVAVAAVDADGVEGRATDWAWVDVPAGADSPPVVLTAGGLYYASAGRPFRLDLRGRTAGEGEPAWSFPVYRTASSTGVAGADAEGMETPEVFSDPEASFDTGKIPAGSRIRVLDPAAGVPAGGDLVTELRVESVLGATELRVTPAVEGITSGITYEVVAPRPSWLRIEDSPPRLVGDPLPAHLGAHEVQVAAGVGAARTVLPLTVMVVLAPQDGGEGSPPRVATALPARELHVDRSWPASGEEWSAEVAVHDADGDAGAVQVLSGPDGLRVANGRLEWTPRPYQAGPRPAVLMTEDARGHRGTAVLDLEVGPELLPAEAALADQVGVLLTGKDKVSGRFRAPDEVPCFRFLGKEGEQLSLTFKVKKDLRSPSVVLLAPPAAVGAVDLAAHLKARGSSVAVKGLSLPRTGWYRLELRAGGGSGEYRLKLKLKTKGSAFDADQRAGEVSRFAWGLQADETIRLRLKARKSDFRADAIRVYGPDGDDQDAVVVLDPTHGKAKVSFTAGRFGDYDVVLGGAAGAFRAKIKRKVPKRRANKLDLFEPPALASVEPAEGRAGGGDVVTLRGSGFLTGLRVFIGAAEATEVVVAGDGLSATATTPAGEGTEPVRVLTADGQTAAGPAFVYLPPPVLATGDPLLGPIAGGTRVTLAGSGFRAGATEVRLDGEPAPGVTVAGGGTEVSFSTPAHAAGTVEVQVVDDLGQVSAGTLAFEFLRPPVPAALDPALAPTAGGGPFLLTGADFLPGMRVFLDGVEAPFVEVEPVGRARAHVTLPPGEAGPADVRVLNPDGQEGTLVGAVTYRDPPRIGQVDPTSGPKTGGTTITVEGSGFVAGAVVRVRGDPATDVTVASGSRLTAVTPAGSVGAASVTVENPDGQTDRVEDAFIYVNRSPTAEVTSPSGEYDAEVRGDDVYVNYLLLDADGDDCSVTVSYTTDGGGTWLPAARRAGYGEGLEDLAASEGGVPHTFAWDSVADLGYRDLPAVRVRVAPDDGDGGTAGVSTTFRLNDNREPVASLGAPPGGTPENALVLTYTLVDRESDPATVAVDFSLDGDTFLPATRLSGEGTSELETSPGGTAHTFVWDAKTDLASSGEGTYTGLTLRVVPADLETGQADARDDFAVTVDLFRWAKLVTSGGPGSVTLHTAVRDSLANRMLVFGGYTQTEGGSIFNSKDLWAVDLDDGSESWAKLSSWSEDRVVHAAFFDPNGDRMVVFGGLSQGQAKDKDGNVVVVEFASDAKGVWKGVVTTADATAGRPDSGRLYASFVYDSVNRRGILFGGEHEFGSHLNDVWALDVSGTTPAWNRLVLGDASNPGYPAPRGKHAACYDSARERMIVYGGEPESGDTLSDVWAYSLKSGAEGWTKLSPDGTGPGARLELDAAYDEANDRMIVYGGSGGDSTVWALDFGEGSHGEWKSLATDTSESPGFRRNHRMVWDPELDRLVLFGGASDVWELR